MKTLGLILLVAGIIMLVVRGFNYTTKEKVVDAGPIEISKRENHTLVWPYYAGAVLAIGGIALIAAAPKRSR